jgi:hypothetical protein
MIISDIQNRPMKRVDIRFNTNYPASSKYEWRVLVNGIETLVNEVICHVPSFTSSAYIEGHGMKWHMSAFAEDVIISFSTEMKSAHIL